MSFVCFLACHCISLTSSTSHTMSVYSAATFSFATYSFWTWTCLFFTTLARMNLPRQTYPVWNHLPLVGVVHSDFFPVPVSLSYNVSVIFTRHCIQALRGHSLGDIQSCFIVGIKFEEARVKGGDGEVENMVFGRLGDCHNFGCQFILLIRICHRCTQNRIGKEMHIVGVPARSHIVFVLFYTLANECAHAWFMISMISYGWIFGLVPLSLFFLDNSCLNCTQYIL